MVFIINLSYNFFTCQAASSQGLNSDANDRGDKSITENRFYRCCFIRQSLINRGCSEDISNITSSWRKGTNKQYDWRKWVLWCGGQHANPFYPSEHLAIAYLMYLIRLNMSYFVLNTHKSMLMQTLPYFGVTWCNKSNLISRVMKGYVNIKPVQYKPKITWDVSKVLNYISSLYPLQSLCLKLLTFKLITPVALTTAGSTRLAFYVCLS
jgi:hypothetical protein